MKRMPVGPNSERALFIEEHKYESTDTSTDKSPASL